MQRQQRAQAIAEYQRGCAKVLEVWPEGADPDELPKDQRERIYAAQADVSAAGDRLRALGIVGNGTRSDGDVDEALGDEGSRVSG